MNKTLKREVDKLQNKLSNEEINEILMDVTISCSGEILTFMKKGIKAEVFHRTTVGEKQRYFKSFVNFKQNNGKVESIDWIELTEYKNSKIYQSEMRNEKIKKNKKFG